jgi:hypothetical protein
LLLRFSIALILYPDTALVKGFFYITVAILIIGNSIELLLYQNDPFLQPNQIVDCCDDGYTQMDKELNITNIA